MKAVLVWWGTVWCNWCKEAPVEDEEQEEEEEEDRAASIALIIAAWSSVSGGVNGDCVFLIWANIAWIAACCGWSIILV